MSAFLIAAGLALVFLAGSVFALQPSPRQRQLAQLRQAAVGAGLRVRVRPGEDTAEYQLAWRVPDLDGARLTDFAAERDSAGAWALQRRSGPPESVLRAALAALPESASRLAGGADGLVVRWHERGEAAVVRSIADVLLELREHCAAAR